MRLGTLVEMMVIFVFSLAVAFAYSWITTFVVVGFMPILIGANIFYFSLVTGQSKSSKGLDKAYEVCVLM